MGLLLGKIAFLLLLAAAFGAWLARWYLRRRYEDVTVQYSSWQSDWTNWRRQLDRRLSEPGQAVDWAPMMSRMNDLETSLRDMRSPVPKADLEPLATRLHALEQAVLALAAAHKAPRS